VSGVRTPGACRDCLRRSWLLARLGASLDYRCADVSRLTEALALDDDQLLDALAGTRRAALRTEFLRFDPSEVPQPVKGGKLCRHDPGYPASLRDAGAPAMLHVRGALTRLRGLTRAPVVAVVGSRRATDYGLEVARSLATGLAASGITVVAGLTDGIAQAAHSGVLEAGAPALGVVGGGLDVGRPQRQRSLIERLCGSGCAVSELPSDCDGRRWGPVAAERIVVRLAELTIVVEADDSARELAGAHLARALGRRVAAVPGRVSSRASRGTNALLIDGARLVRGPEDALELLDANRAARAGLAQAPCRRLEPRLAEVLERVGEGRDRPDEIALADDDVGDLLLALSELELMGLLARGDGGRYVPRGFA
jgi:DNA processing protein